MASSGVSCKALNADSFTIKLFVSAENTYEKFLPAIRSKSNIGIQKYVAAWRIEIEKYFVVVAFNYTFSNGDAHLKNFSKKLFSDDFQSAAWKKSGHASAAGLLEFGKRIGVVESRYKKLLFPFLERQANVESLINRSFLDAGSKRAYLLHYNTKRKYLNT